MFIVLIQRTCSGLHGNILTPLGSKNEWPLFFADGLVTSDCQRLLSVVAIGCRFGIDTFAFQLSKNVRQIGEAQQLVLERGRFVIVETEVPLIRFLGGTGIQGKEYKQKL